MNFFFGIRSKFINSEIKIPKFQNSGKFNQNIKVFEAFPLNNKWNINKTDCDENKDFYFISNEIENNKIFFLAHEHEVAQNKIKLFDELKDFNNFTDTAPAFRANLKLFLDNGGISSYQSEYPFEMTKRRGNILSPISILLNKNAEKNIIFFKNIFYKPINEKTYLYFINFQQKKIVKKVEILSNYLNEIIVDKEFLNNDIYLFTENCLGIPMYLSIKNFHLSFEHTHPPHHYILSQNRYKKINILKNEFKKIFIN